MARQISMATRKELIAAVGARYRAAGRAERAKILNEFTNLTGFHRKHAVRVLANEPRDRPPKRCRARLYGPLVKEALIVVWEAADRICGKRLKALIPTLVGAMELHGRAAFDPEIREPLLRMSAASIDRLLSDVREQAGGQRKRRPSVGSAIRRSVRKRAAKSSCRARDRLIRRNVRLRWRLPSSGAAAARRFGCSAASAVVRARP